MTSLCRKESEPSQRLKLSSRGEEHPAEDDLLAVFFGALSFAESSDLGFEFGDLLFGTAFLDTFLAFDGVHAGEAPKERVLCFS